MQQGLPLDQIITGGYYRIFTPNGLYPRVKITAKHDDGTITFQQAPYLGAGAAEILLPEVLTVQHGQNNIIILHFVPPFVPPAAAPAPAPIGGKRRRAQSARRNRKNSRRTRKNSRRTRKH